MSSRSIFRSFRDYHRRVLAQLDELEHAALEVSRCGRLGARSEATIQRGAALLSRQFATHMCSEEEILFPALADAFPESMPGIGQLRVEHRELRSMLARLAALLAGPTAPSRDEQVSVQVRDLVDLLRIHIQKEERAVFSVAVRVLSPQEIRVLHDRIVAHHEQDPGPQPERSRPGGQGA